MLLKNNLNSVIQHLISGGYNITSVFDVGANAGRWTAIYSKLLPKALFCMFEANPNQASPTLASNHRWFNAVLSSPEVSKVEFYTISGTGDSYYKEQTKAYTSCIPITLPTTTLDKLATQHNITPPQLMKIDTQGSELDILRGAVESIKSVDILVTETAVLPYNKGAPNFNDYLSAMSELGFVPIGIEEIHISNNILVQLDIVYLKQDIKEKYYGNNGFLQF